MLGKITLLADHGFPYYEGVESWLGGLKASTEYLINLSNIVQYRAWDTNDSLIRFKLNLEDDSSPEFLLLVDETTAALKTLADAVPASEMVTLDVFEGAYTFIDVPDCDTVEYDFAIKHILWGSRNEANTATRLVVAEGGFIVRVFFVEQTLDAIVDLADTGTTTTTSTSSTSTSSTSTSSTSTSSTSTTSTSSTSTSSTSSTSTSTSSTSTSSTSTTSTSSTSSTSTYTTSTSTTSTSSTTSTTIA